MAEVVVLDPSEVSHGRTELDITFHIGAGGPDWGDAAIEAFLADGYRGQVPVDFKVPNRQVTIPLTLHSADTEFTFDQMRQFVQAKAALFQREGGWLKREITGGVVYADVVGATLHYGGSSSQARGDDDPDAVLTLECIPDFYGDEVSLGTHSEVDQPELIFTETGVKGDYPARVRLVVDEDDGETQRGLLWGMRSRHYQDVDTARLAYQAEDLTPLDSADVSGDVFASEFSVVRHSSFGKIATPVMGTTLAGGDEMTHTGTYRVFARVTTQSTLAVIPDNVRLRFVWDVGDFTNPTENGWWSFPGRNVYYVADLGEIRIDAPAAGAHRWQGQLQAVCLEGGRANVWVDKLWFLPLDDGAGVLRAPVTGVSSGAFTVSTSQGLADSSETAGNLNGKTMYLGGSWATSGDATDFTVAVLAGTSTATRATTADTADVGRLALAGTTTGGVLANQMLFQWDAVPSTSPVAMLYQRWADDTHNVHARVFNQNGTGFVYVYYRNGGAFTQVAQAVVPALTPNTVYLFRMATDMSGAVVVWLGLNGTNLDDPVIVTSSSLLQAGGALASGRHGFREYWDGGTAINRYYNWYSAWPYGSDAVLFPSRSAELTYSGMFREASDGGSYGPVPSVTGDLPRLPPSGLESRTIEVFLKGSRGDLGHIPDTGIDDLGAQLFYRPSWLFVPETINPDALFPAVDLYPSPDLFPEI